MNDLRDIEQRLIEMLAESEDPRAAFEASALAEDPQARALVQGMLDAEEQLAAVGETERAERAEWGGAGEARTEGRAEAALRRKVEASRPRRGRSLRLAVVGAVAVAAGLLVMMQWPTEKEPPVDRSRMSERSSIPMSPSGRVERFERFEWSVEVPAGGWFVVRVYSDMPDADLVEPILQSPRLQSPSWEPSEEQRRALPPRIRWVVEISTGDAGRSFSNSFSRRAQRPASSDPPPEMESGSSPEPGPAAEPDSGGSSGPPSVDADRDGGADPGRDRARLLVEEWSRRPESERRGAAGQEWLEELFFEVVDPARELPLSEETAAAAMLVADKLRLLDGGERLEWVDRVGGRGVPRIAAYWFTRAAYASLVHLQAQARDDEVVRRWPRWAEAIAEALAPLAPGDADRRRVEGTLPFLRYLHVESLRRLERGDEARRECRALLAAMPRERRAVDEAASGEASVDRLADRFASLRRLTRMLEARIELDLGLPAVAGSRLKPVLDEIEALPERERTRDVVIHADLYAVEHALAVADGAGAVQRAREALAQDFYAAASQAAARAQLEILLGQALAMKGADEPAAAVEAIERGLAGPLGMRARVDGLLALMRLALERGDRSAATAADRSLAECTGSRELPASLHAEWQGLRARAALDRAADVDELQALLPALRASSSMLLEAWRRSPPREAGLSFLLYGNRLGPLVEHLRLELAVDRDGAISRVIDLLQELHDLAALSRKLPPRSRMDRARVQGDLREGEGLLVYVVGPDRGLVLALDAEGSAVEDLNSREELFDRRDSYLEILRRPRSEWSDPRVRAAEGALARELARDLFPGRVARRMAGWSALRVMGEETLGFMPLANLPLGDGPRLGVAKELSWMPSLSAWSAWSETPAPPLGRRELAILADPTRDDSDPELPALPLDSRWVEEVRAAWGEDRVEFLEGDAVDLPGLHHALRAPVAVLQFFAHGIQDSTRERSAGVLLGASAGHSGRVFAEHVEALPHAPRLALLGFCRSGFARARRGEVGGTDLAGAFLAAGSRCVLVRHGDWSLDSCRALSSAFLRELAGGARPAAALRSARERLHAQDPASYPFRYGALRLIGAGHEPVATARPATRQRARAAWPWSSILGGAAAVLLALAWALRGGR